MIHPKCDGRLASALQQRQSRGRAYSLTDAEIAGEAFPVTIQHRDALRVPAKKGERNAAISELQKRHQKSQDPVLKQLKEFGVEIEQNVLSNSITARLTEDQIARVGDIEAVSKIRLAKAEKVTCLNDSVPIIGGLQVWQLGFTGQGVKVAVLDTGIDKSHPALGDRVVEEVSTHPQEGVDVPGDHGTHCAGIIASQDPYYRGVAPGVEIINVKVLDAHGNGSHDYVIRGMFEAARLGADVVSMSLGWSHIYHGWECPDGDCELCRAAEALIDMGIVVVVAAGNEDNERGDKADTNIRCPGNARRVITVGAVDKGKHIAPFSSRGPTPYGKAKPDVVAPGMDITSTWLRGDFHSINGTSMACPHVAGVVALMLQKNPDASPPAIKTLLKHTAEHIGYSPNDHGAGLVNAHALLLH